jgi:hypothetical protein
MSDPLLDLVSRLPPSAVSPERARRVQKRCHRVLARRAPTPDTGQPLRGGTWSRVLVSLATIYLAEALRQALRGYGSR